MFPVLRRVRVRRWAPLLVLVLGMVGAGMGAIVGEPNSWLWFGAGAVLAVVIATATSWRRSHHPR
jgi:hypothetical protein